MPARTAFRTCGRKATIKIAVLCAPLGNEDTANQSKSDMATQASPLQQAQTT
jgi:hypothetical protein